MCPVRLRGVGPPVDRLDRYLLHQRRHVQPTDLDAVGGNKVAQHPAARKREVHVQHVDPPHDREVGSQHRLRQIIYAAAADPQLSRLPCHRQRVRTVDHRFALGNSPAQLRIRAERPGQKIIHQRQLADLGVAHVFTSIAGSANSP